MADLVTILHSDLEVFLDGILKSLAANKVPKQIEMRYTVISTITLIEAMLAEAAHEMWDYSHTEEVSNIEILAVNNKTIGVKSSGEIELRDLKLDNKTKFKAIAKLISKLKPKYAARFKETGWSAVLSTTDTRNRLIHPKNVQDLEVSLEEVENAMGALRWILSNRMVWLEVNSEHLKAQLKFVNALSVVLHDRNV